MRGRVRITFVLPRAFKHPVGGAKIVYEYASRLAARGHDVHVVHPRAPDLPLGIRKAFRRRVWAARRTWLGRPLVPWHPVDPRVRLLAVPDLRGRFVPDADAVFATAFETAAWVHAYASSKGSKYYLVQGHETWRGDQSAVDATWRLPLHKVVISRSLLALAEALGVAGDTTYIPNGIDFSQFRVVTPIDRRAAARVAMLAHPLEFKGTADGVAALELARAQAPRLEAGAFGTAPRPSELPAWIEYVRSPSLAKLVELYNSARLFLHTSWMEGFGLPPAEAMACGCAVVAVRNDGITEYAIDGETAVLAPSRDPRALADGILALLLDDERRSRLAEAGHRSIQRFTWSRSIDAMESLLARRA
jgi:glycosyltransferase involved in cell wall biosynthesis